MRSRATPTQRYSYKVVCGVGVPEVLFFRFDEVGNRIPYWIWRLRFTLNYFTFLHFISIFILMTRRNATEALYIGKQLSNYPHQLPEMPRYCCPIEISFCFLVYRDVTKIENCSPRPSSKRSTIKMFFLRTLQNGLSWF